MQIPLLNDLRNDKSLKKNLGNIGLFLILVLILDYLSSVLLLKGIEINYGLNSDAEVLLVGHSHLMLAVDKALLEQESGYKIAKYTREGVNISDRKIMIRHYFTTCLKKPELVVLGIDPWLFTGEGLSKNSYLLFLPFMDNPDIRAYVRKSVPRNFDYSKAKWIRSTRFNSTLINASLRGYLRNWENFKLGMVDTVQINNEISLGNYRRITFDKDLINDFSSILDYLREENVNVILLNTPVYKPMINVQSDAYLRVMNTIDSVSKARCPKAFLVDLVPQFSNNSSLFFDPIHLNPDGQKVVTDYFSAIVDSVGMEKRVGDIGPISGKN